MCNRNENGAGHHRSTRLRSIRQSAVPKHHIDAVEWYARLLVNDLRKGRVRASSNILRAAVDRDAPIGVELDVCGAGQPHSYPTGSSNTPAENFAIASHRSDARCALLPAELLCANLKTLPIMPRGEGNVLLFILFGIVQNAELHWIDLQLIR